MSCLTELMKKMSERSPLNVSFVAHAKCFDPCHLVVKSKHAAGKMEKLVTVLFEKDHLNAKEADAAKEEFEKFQNKVVKKNREKFESFDTVLQRLDTFYLDCVPDIMTRYANL